ncbi:phage baseplate assembly protein V [Maridesulfovibrio ferrireducens]|uniref:phage baseplate assembly protein V n=1 Tax=Maridesulfovibrio ferrireducens TaxID=246191 RepID=UPI001A198CBF|nr:phage baseplate assembly protein V [Maridesulfovibrio ferrireducens]MBI9112243.1 phage baseplate assembly protein V [Maridesulfovibrio ferrireducens]
MSGLSQILDRLDSLESALAQVVRVGKVVSLIPERGTVRVQFPDADASGKQLVSYELPVLAHKTLHDKSYWMPDVDEHVLCVFLPFAQRQGFVVSAFYSDADTVPLSDPDVRHVIFKDGSWFQYDRKKHFLSGHVVNGCADLEIDIDAKLTVGQDLTANIGRDTAITIGRDLSAKVVRDVGAEIGRNASLDITNDLSATVGNNATIEVTETLEATAKNIQAEATEKAEIKAGQSIDLTSPLINITGDITCEGNEGAIGHEDKRAHTEHEGSYHLTGDSIIVGHLHVKTLTVDDPINGTLAV